MKAYRLCKCKWARDLSGRGAETAGGRWNSKGVPVLYTAGSRALATVEVAVHTPLGNLPEDYCMVTLELPDGPIAAIKQKDLPADWNSWPAPVTIKQFGDSFIEEGEFLILKVPSATVDGDFNYLINPQHRKAGEIRVLSVRLFSFDKRLFKKNTS